MLSEEIHPRVFNDNLQSRLLQRFVISMSVSYRFTVKSYASLSQSIELFRSLKQEDCEFSKFQYRDNVDAWKRIKIMRNNLFQLFIRKFSNSTQVVWEKTVRTRVVCTPITCTYKPILTRKRENQWGFVVSFEQLLEKDFRESYKKEGNFLEDDREKNAAALFDTIDSFVCDDTVCKYVAVSLYSPARGLRSGRHPGGVNGTSADGRSPFPNTTTLSLQYGTRGGELNRVLTVSITLTSSDRLSRYQNLFLTSFYIKHI